MKAAFYTLGCKVNQYESEYMAELLRSAGFESCPRTRKRTTTSSTLVR